MTRSARHVNLASRPNGAPVPANFEVVEAEVPPAAEGDIVSPTGAKLAGAGEVRDGGSFLERMGSVVCWNSVMDENQYMVRKWNEFIAA